MAETTAIDTAHYLLAVSSEAGDYLTNLKLQKLLYYAQAWNLALYDQPLFEDCIEAWVHGPVVPSVYREFKEFGFQPIDREVVAPSLSDQVTKHLDEILRVFGGFSSYQLEVMAHSESPWQKARGDIPNDKSSTNRISHEDMMSFYRALAEQPSDGQEENQVGETA